MFSWLEKNPFFFAVFVFIFIAYAGIVEILPDFADRARPVENKKPYTVLQLAGRQVYINDSCNACHSQLIRPFKSETDRYGMYSISGEYAYDRPFLWGSKRTGPDLWRVGNYRSTDWHENHMKDPTSVVPGSIMPAYKHMFNKNADIETAYAEAFTVKKVFNVPYDTEGMPKLGTLEEAKTMVNEEAAAIVEQMKDQDVKDAFARGEIREIVALIAYLNSLK
ncbi:cytochrome-c oxidase, cbb3-type subunit II [Campylobacter hyointestinalis subsp. hyointestinalis]|uniref:cytochrome-c oxidase, cbb3-type subunit II n=1 Tax=Campylobacter hyointestinalis TaxID=198 RepID=UPI0007245195|nr:cytochrome-c oxidase, cbb3-type subunit II [Campylobacter hyointestinalis]PPB53155.1 cytochrome c oxidase, cbb3-type subunit II [Campylobacter hyointestinalis subsp. hyointestinalis]PPB55336.1 cytochrome c oxidase, cbb3-type subunit II [Campylobacter hyointestinalis subsp. hyointestinalis]PPB58374.1 cytochrome c oxidase, cbb3-type subunit II [Campylobacter hyointestinalis subsp. hyointestinalis]PPB62436.1 cytochrome c oxidase, cbb3-type subunit II [Campylobacter hyointestinalis subsp. hyoint